MIGCLVLAFQLCNPNTQYGGYAYQPGYVQQPTVVYAQPQVVYAQPQVVYAQPVYIAQPQYYGGYGNAYPFGGNGIGVHVGRRGGVSVRCC